MPENKLQILIKSIFNRIKEKYGYTDEQALIYLKGYKDCAEEHQQALEKRDKMLRDTVEELCEAKQLLKAAVEDVNFSSICLNRDACKVCAKRYNISCEKKFKWRYANEALALIGDEPNGI